MTRSGKEPLEWRGTGGGTGHAGVERDRRREVVLGRRQGLGTVQRWNPAPRQKGAAG